MLTTFSLQKIYHGCWWLSVAKLIIPQDVFRVRESNLRFSAALLEKMSSFSLKSPYFLVENRTKIFTINFI